MKKLTIVFLISTLLYGCSNDLGTSSTNPGTGQGGSLARFAISDDYMFAVNGTTLKVFSLINPEHPRFISSTELGVNVETIFMRDSATMFIGSTDGMFIYDVSQAPEIEMLSSYRHVTSCDPVVVNHNYAYVTLRSSGEERFCNHGVNQMEIIDISNLTAPQLMNTITMDYPIGLGLHGDTLLVCDNGVKVFSIENPLNPYLITAQPDIDAVDIIPYGRLMIIATSTGIAQYEYLNGQLKLLSEI